MSTRKSNAVRKDEFQPEPPAKAGKKMKPQLVKKSTTPDPADPPANVAISPEPSPAADLNQSFKSQAKKLDKQIRTIVSRIEKDWITLGEYFDEMHAKGYHVALGHKRFETYLAEVIPEKSKTQVFQAMRIVRELTSGEQPAVSKEDLREMTRDNAEGLARLRSRGEQITTTLIEAAKSETIKAFAETVAKQTAAPSTPVASSEFEATADSGTATAPQDATALDGAPAPNVPNEVVFRRKTFTVTEETAQELELCYQIGLLVVRDDDRDIPLDDKILQSMCAEYRSQYEATYQQHLRAEEAAALSRALTTSGQMGPEDEVETEIETAADPEWQNAESAEPVFDASGERVVVIDEDVVLEGAIAE